MDNQYYRKIEEKIKYIYPDSINFIMENIKRLTDTYKKYKVSNNCNLTERDVILITYGDSIIDNNEKPLKTLNHFLNDKLSNVVSAVHLLPIYPYTSDDGFSVVDYKKINESLGDWEDVKEISKGKELMLDAVINHISASSYWFKGFLEGNEEYKDYFIVSDPSKDYSKVTRPRSLPLLTKFNTSDGEKYVWTTFSEDQIDLNFKNPKVFIEILDTLAFYCSMGARFIRLDAIGFMFKKDNTTCMHLPETHDLIKAMKLFLEINFPNVVIITETNVPHKDNVSYFGNGDEANMVYQFPLPPLTLFSFVSGDATKLTEWAKNLGTTPSGTTFFNFLSSHDGIGVRPVEGILSEDEIQLLLDNTVKNGGFVSYKDNGDGTKSPYELNINYLNALANQAEKIETKIKKSLAAHTILFSMAGVPAVYIHSLLGSENDREGAETSGIYRRINREKLNLKNLSDELSKDSLRKGIYEGFVKLSKIRRSENAFSPFAEQNILNINKSLFALERFNKNTNEKIIAIINVSCDSVTVNEGFIGKDLIGDREITEQFELLPYEAAWIKLK